jgi:hypothetical protein
MFWEAHPKAVKRFLAEVETEYRQPTSWEEQPKAREMVSYVENHYRYEDMPNYRGTDVAVELAKQRRRTIDAIEEWIKRNE